MKQMKSLSESLNHSFNWKSFKNKSYTIFFSVYLVCDSHFGINESYIGFFFGFCFFGRSVVYIISSSKSSYLIDLFFQPDVHKHSLYLQPTKHLHTLTPTLSPQMLNQQFCSPFDLVGSLAQCQAVQCRLGSLVMDGNKSCSVPLFVRDSIGLMVQAVT